MTAAVPDAVQVNAWTGPASDASGPLAATAPLWGVVGTFPRSAEEMGPPDPPTPDAWRDARVGWGVVLPENLDPRWSPADKALARDAPEPVQDLVARRNPPGPAPVYRYDAELFTVHKLRRYLPDGGVDEPLVGEAIGTAVQQIASYLLIVAGPKQVPWRVQYALNQRHHVGRLDAEPVAGLRHYVDALLSDWDGADPDPGHAVVWSVDNGIDGDITREMRLTVAHPLFEKLDGDDEISPHYMGGPEATYPALRDALALHRPAVVVSTSHGQTTPPRLDASLGLPVGQDDRPVDIGDLMGAWDPSGAVWYAHACCSAGSDDDSNYDGLLTPGSQAYDAVRGVTAGDPLIASLPKALLGAERPLRAFVGHVEPTFDWTLRDADTRQHLTTGIKTALYDKLYNVLPLGLALDEYYQGVGQLYSRWVKLYDSVNGGDLSVRPDATRLKLTAKDRESLVILGDPTVIVPPLPSKARAGP